MDYREHRLTDMPPSLHYIPDFISAEEEERLLSSIAKTSHVKWTQLSNRRLQNWGGVPHQKGMIQEAIPPWLQSVVDKVNAVGTFESGHLANHVLLNEYLPGQGIMPHKDGDLFHPVISTVSLGSHTVLNFYKASSDEDVGKRCPSHRVLVEPRSLLLVADDLYHDYMHGIEEKDEDEVGPGAVANAKEEAVLKRGTRISLTIRHVPKTSKVKLKLGR